jgi:RpiR family transcriptional regulator, carbohydrate utilization regulator
VHRAAGVTIEQPDRVTKISVSELAAATQASEGSVIGLCQQIGASGFPELIAIAKEASAGRALLHEDVGPADSVTHIVQKITRSHMVAVEDMIKVLDEAEHDARAAAHDNSARQSASMSRFIRANSATASFA